MYKSIKIGRVELSFQKFKKSVKDLSTAYHNGYQYHKADHYHFHFLVFGIRRIGIAIQRRVRTCCG